jgi:hypothetical protein
VAHRRVLGQRRRWVQGDDVESWVKEGDEYDALTEIASTEGNGALTETTSTEGTDQRQPPGEAGDREAIVEAGD